MNRNTRWNLFLDDQWRDIRDPKKIDPSKDYYPADSVKEAISLIESMGCPIFISFDYDLGGEESIILANWLIDKDLDSNGFFIPKDFNFQIHSANVWSSNLLKLSNYLKAKNDC